MARSLPAPEGAPPTTVLDFQGGLMAGGNGAQGGPVGQRGDMQDDQEPPLLEPHGAARLEPTSLAEAEGR